MLTVFSIPKPFEGEIGELQRAALRSWTALPGVEVILLGDDTGVAEAAAAAGAGHIETLARSEGTPRLDDAFAQVEQRARHRLLCFVNADILLGEDLLAAVGSVTWPRFLLVGQTVEEGVRRGVAAIDYFVFPSGLFGRLPPFVVGRAGFDNWLIWRARQVGPVIDATDAVVAVHQRHDYAHLAAGKEAAYYGPEAQRNIELAGGRGHIYTLHDASHRMHADLTVHRNLGSVLRLNETVRKVKWKLGVR